ncbi:MAG TPA: DUF4012 domain-containing protein [Leifsonia sp.]|nr:DUF4012 domain-containing protein [Leifsonia sp.]
MAAPDTSRSSPMRSPQAAPDGRTRRIVGWSVAGVVLVLLLLAGWVGVRALLAKNALQSALPYANAVQSSLASGDIPAATAAAAKLRDHAAQAAALTEDPVWRAAEFLPVIGPNLSAVRISAAATDTVASRVVEPLTGVAQLVDPARLKPVDGAVDLAPLSKAQPTIARAQRAFHEAFASVAAIDDGPTIGPVRSAVERLRTLLSTTEPAVDAVGNSAALLPGMLGSDGPRTYLLLVQNPAELRATGGLVGALALVTADHGKIALAAQASGTSMKPLTEPIVNVSAATQGLYGPLTARLVQDVNLAPDFAAAARTASAMWTAQFGGTVDGVLTMDPVGLATLLKATGPVALPTGDLLSAKNAVPLLLNQVYSRWADPSLQDAFFESAAGAVFHKVAAGSTDGAALVKALTEVGQERRMFIWSAHPSEQKVLASTTLAGGLPQSTASSAALGVYFDDATGAKMDYYLATRVEAGSAICRIDGKPTSRISITLTNTAPADAGRMFPDYVTGAGSYGVTAGNIRTRVAVYGASDGLLVSTKSGDSDYPTVAGTDQGRPVSVFTVELAPGQSKTVTVDLLDVKQKSPSMTVDVTPTLGVGTPDMGASPRVSTIALDCATTLK